MEEQTEDMDEEWEMYHQPLQHQDNFDPATGESGTAEPAERDRACAQAVPPVLCQLLSAQAGHRQFMSAVPATGGEELEHQEDLEQSCTTSRQLRLAEMQPD